MLKNGLLNYQSITEDDVGNWNHPIYHLARILNGEYLLDEARKDILGFREEESNEKDL